MNDTTVLPATTGYVSQPNCGRGTLDIIWTCLSTIFLSIWVTGHIEIGDPRYSKLSFRTRRICHAIGSLFAPEVVVAGSILNLFRAVWLKRRISAWLKHPRDDSVFELDKDATFSLRQAFVFVKQGVYLASEHDDESKPIKFDELETLLQENPLYFKDLPTNDEIDDRSKSDWILKTFSIFQTLWFLANVIYRLRVGLQVSLLEDMTAAHAFCGFLQLVAWLRCPQDICRCWILKPRTASSTAPRNDEAPVALFKKPGPFKDEPSLKGTAQRLQKEAASFNPTMVQWIAMTISATVFVGFHLAPWRYPFVTVAEKWLWISCSVATLFLLILLYAISFLAKAAPGSRKALGITSGVTIFLLYLPVRLIMISLAFAAFRDAPVGIYEKPSWADLLPHL